MEPSSGLRFLFLAMTASSVTVAFPINQSSAPAPTDGLNRGSAIPVVYHQSNNTPSLKEGISASVEFKENLVLSLSVTSSEEDTVAKSSNTPPLFTSDMKASTPTKGIKLPAVRSMQNSSNEYLHTLRLRTRGGFQFNKRRMKIFCPPGLWTCLNGHRKKSFP